MKTNKAEIYKNAFRLFLQDNYEKVTVVKLEKAIGLSCRGIYHHTKDKLGLFKAVVDTYIFEPHKVENKFVFTEDISLRDFLQSYIEGVERTMDYLSNELGVDRKECAKCYLEGNRNGGNQKGYYHGRDRRYVPNGTSGNVIRAGFYHGT